MNYHNIEFVSSFKYNQKCNIIIQKVKELVEYSDNQIQTYITVWADHLHGKRYEYSGQQFVVEITGIMRYSR